MVKPIRTVFDSNHIRFERACAALVKSGYVLSSSSCNSTDAGVLWCAVFIKQEDHK
jgi:hypothetical protein